MEMFVETKFREIRTNCFVSNTVVSILSISVLYLNPCIMFSVTWLSKNTVYPLFPPVFPSEGLYPFLLTFIYCNLLLLFSLIAFTLVFFFYPITLYCLYLFPLMPAHSPGLIPRGPVMELSRTTSNAKRRDASRRTSFSKNFPNFIADDSDDWSQRLWRCWGGCVTVYVWQ